MDFSDTTGEKRRLPKRSGLKDIAISSPLSADEGQHFSNKNVDDESLSSSESKTIEHAKRSIKESYATIGTIRSAHSLQGGVRLELYLDADDVTFPFLQQISPFRYSDNADDTLDIVSFRKMSPFVGIAHFKDVVTRTQAENLHGNRLVIPRARLPHPPQGEIYMHDTIGAKVYTSVPQEQEKTSVAPDTSRLFGVVVGTANYGAGPLLKLKNSTGHEVLAPFHSDLIDSTNIDSGWLIIDKGLADGLADVVSQSSPTEIKNT